MFRTSLLSMLLAAPALLAQAPTLDQVLAKHYEAKGGLAKIKAVKSMRITGKMSGGPAEFPMVIEQKRPNQFRLEINFQGNQMIQAYDGKSGWSINPFASAKKDPEPMTPEEVREMEVQADIDGPLVDWKEKGHKVELQGHEAVEGSDAYKLKLSLKNGDISYVYLDSDSYLDVKQSSKRKVRDTEVESETITGDFKEVGGLMIAHSIEVGMKGSPQKQKINLDKVELNVLIDEARFKMPEKKVAAVPAPAAAPAKSK